MPPYRHEPGQTPHPERSPEGHMVGPEPEPRDDDFRFAVDLFNDAYWWEAHVYWERLWTASESEDDKEFLQGLIQLAAALVKRRAGSREGEAKLMAKSLQKLRAVQGRAGDVYRTVDLRALIELATRSAPPTIQLRP